MLEQLSDEAINNAVVKQEAALGRVIKPDWITPSLRENFRAVARKAEQERTLRIAYWLETLPTDPHLYQELARRLRKLAGENEWHTPM